MGNITFYGNGLFCIDWLQLVKLSTEKLLLALTMVEQLIFLRCAFVYIFLKPLDVPSHNLFDFFNNKDLLFTNLHLYVYVTISISNITCITVYIH